MEAVGFGIIGTEEWGELHARILASTGGTTLAGVADLHPHRAESLAQAYGSMHYADYRTLLADDLVKAVSILTPADTHAEVALAAAQAGKHVLIQPPLAVSTDDCRRIIEAAGRSGVWLMPDFRGRWIPRLKEMYKSLRRGQIGEARRVTCRVAAGTDIPEGEHRRTSILWHSGIHAVDLARRLLGGDVARAYALAGSRMLEWMEIGMPDYYQALLEFNSGATSFIECSWIPPGSGNVMEISCEVAGSGGALRAELGYGQDAYSDPKGFAGQSVHHFIDCVLHDAEPAITVRDALEATRITQAMEESARTGMPVAVG